MKSLNEIFPSWTEALGWTLLNSIWQGLLIMILVIFLLRIIPSKSSQLRYVVSCVAMTLFVITSLVTFITLINEPVNSLNELTINFANQNSPIIAFNVSDLSGSSVFQTILLKIESSMNWILMAWIAGTLFFTLRMLAGWWYVNSLKSESEILSNEWSDRLQQLARQFNINTIVTLAQSTRIEAPVVLGFIKPVVLVPVGMFSGLTTEQIETIFIHELAHIKRHDYLVNLIQSFIETIFFFNPFVWIISNIIRREREYCCDDAVIQNQGSALVYARALTSLEDVRLSRAAFALSLAENKNQLLNRIKRLMQKSVKNYSGRDRLIPALLLIVGLICASWLTIRNEASFTTSFENNALLQDTTKRSKKPTKTVSKEKEKQVATERERESEWKSPQVWVAPGTPVPPRVFSMTPRYDADMKWEEFSAQFEKSFKEKFGEFYKTHQKDFDGMMKQLEEKFKEDSGDEVWENIRAYQLDGLNKLQELDFHRLEELAKIDQFDVIELEDIAKAEEFARVEQQEAFEALEQIEAIEIPAIELENLDQVLREQELAVAAMEDNLRDMEVQMKAFENRLKKELVADGYVKESDEIKTIDWTDKGLKVNGKMIKESDQEKYRNLKKKYFRGAQINILE